MNYVATSGLRAIVVGGLLAGTVDIGAAALINHASPILIARYIASGLLGRAALSSGAAAAYLGLVLQWAMSVLIAAIYWSATSRMPRLRERWWLGGLLAGVVIYLVMNFVVMPFSAAPVTLHQVIAHFTLTKGAKDLAAMLVFGLIVAFCAHYLVSQPGNYPSRRGAGSAAASVTLLTATSLASLLVARPSLADTARSAQSADPVTLIASARSAIEAANASWLPAMERGDATAVAAAYADDGVLLTAQGTVYRGRAAIAARYRTVLAGIGRVVGGGLVQEGVTVSGGMIYEWGQGWLATQKDGKRHAGSPGTYFTVWRREPDGNWRIYRNLVF